MLLGIGYVHFRVIIGVTCGQSSSHVYTELDVFAVFADFSIFGQNSTNRCHPSLTPCAGKSRTKQNESESKTESKDYSESDRMCMFALVNYDDDLS